MPTAAYRMQMDPIPPSEPDKPRLPSDVQSVVDQHAQVLRVSYMEIASGINRLLRQGIPKEVISQVLNQAVEALAKEMPRTPRTNSTPPAHP
ncbi:MAG TPA: hypothetical protein VGO27_17665 [Candidatus Acidoferrum sp.]|nr:hypothetical protein [Candidatus Acidoferrum sp.]